MDAPAVTIINAELPVATASASRLVSTQRVHVREWFAVYTRIGLATSLAAGR
jgi:hypothetical protein